MDFISDYSKLKIFLNGHQLILTMIESFKITGKINDHGRLKLSAVLWDKDDIGKYTNEVDSFSSVKAVISDGTTVENLFNGIITTLDVKSIQQVGYITIEALSYSYLLDIKQKSRSFQNKNMTYEELAKKVIADYTNAQTMVTDSHIMGKTTGKPFVQFKETDWQFLKRIASNLNVGLVPAMFLENIKFYFGVNTAKAIGSIDQYVVQYNVTKRLNEYNNMVENHKDDLMEQDYIVYRIECKRIMEIGNEVSFQNRKWYVRSVEITVENAVIKYRYELSQKAGLSQKKIYNDKLVGISLEGEVISVSRHDVMVKLDIDSRQSKNDAYWFPFSTVFSSANNVGWYFMPEIGDRVRLYFPDYGEENAVAINAVPIAPTHKDPNIKYISTKHGKEIKITPDGIYIIGKKGKMFIRLSGKDGIEICCDKSINIISKEDIILSSEKKIDMSAEKINISGGSDSKSSEINIYDNVEVKGKQVKVNDAL